MATTDKQIALVEKIIQGGTAIILAICGFFMIRTVGALDEVVDKVADLDKRVTVLEDVRGR
jgi:hypothetical protein